MAVKTKAKPKKKAVAKKAVAKKAVAKKAVAKKPAAKRKTAKKKGAALKTKFLSHGTLIAKNLETTRKFYTEFLGLESIRTSPISLMVRLGGVHVYAVVEQKNHSDKMRYLFHNGLDVTTQEEVDEAHRTTVKQAKKWGIQDISKPILQHGTYSFYFWDLDGNCWEILSNPKDGYTWIFDQGDQKGKGHMAKTFERPGLSK